MNWKTTNWKTMNWKSICLSCFALAMGWNASLHAQEKDHPLTGKWKNDATQTKELLIETGATDIDEVLAQVAEIKLEFRHDGTFTMSMGPTEFTGNWKTEILDAEGRYELTLSIADAPEQKGQLTVRKNGSIVIQPGDASPAVFVAAVAKMVEPTSELLTGLWNGDRDATKKANRTDVPDEMLESVTQTKLELRADGTYSLTMNSGGEAVTVEGTWKLGAKRDDGKTGFHATNDEGDLEFAIWMVGNDQLVFQQGESPATAFLRQEKEEKKDG